ncbi:LysR family transcriptional regulator [Cupriavidus sp. WGtm5]|uniref:LysR family transcriptional regulator n=1 Tax=unclassified Cupriavidus TaxID=2640874 RepID=UPI000E10E1C6|nr:MULTISPECIES: LysR family transcriptional regulator [Cupriavidus]MCO4865518.1 LysR family transcriptional regulator [Cupriavidus sp. WGlv3]MCO4889535.1 LysR family transcriptional regulator [Cupriavidus sp. WGtm5]SPA42392.1 HTH-type transcriptional regulator AlsR [Cupriavidus taiwanensis]
MDLRHLRYFIAVAEELNFTRAAERLHIAQPPLSLQIRQLEEEMDVTLLNRSRRHVELTEAGRIFLEQARQILRATESAVIQTQRAHRGETGRLTVGFFEHASYTLLPPILRAYRERFPSVEILLRWFPVVEQAEALRRGDADISFMRPVPDLEDVTWETILEEPFVLAVPARHPFANAESISLKDCAQEPFIMYMPEAAPDFHAMNMRMCASAGFVPKVVSEVGQVYTLVGLVSSGAGIGFVPASVRQMKFAHVAYKPIKGRQPTVEIMLGYSQRTPTPLMTAFIETAKSIL